MPGAYPLTVEIPSGPEKIPPVKVLTNWLIFIPQFIWVYILSIVAFLAAIVCWFSIVFTGTAPESLSDFIAGVIRYQWRVITGLYVWAEPYPPFAPIPQGFADPGGYPAALNVAPLAGSATGSPCWCGSFSASRSSSCCTSSTSPTGSASSSRGSSPCSPGMEPVTEELLHRRVPVAASRAWYALLLNDEYPPFSLEP